MQLIDKQFTYSSQEFTVANAASDYDVKANENFFDVISVMGHVSLITDATISIKLNATTNDVITITSTESPFVLDRMAINNIYISNASGGNAAIKLKGFQN